VELRLDGEFDRQATLSSTKMLAGAAGAMGCTLTTIYCQTWSCPVKKG
jgi:hypothetical protein